MHRRRPSPFSVALALFILSLFVTPGFLGAQATPPVATNYVRIHCFRPDGNYLGWTVYAFGDTTEDTSNFNGGPVEVTGQDSFGAFFDVGIASAAQNVGIIIHKGNVKDPGPNEFLDPATQGILAAFRQQRTAHHAAAHHPANRSTDSRGQSAHLLSSPGQ